MKRLFVSFLVAAVASGPIAAAEPSVLDLIPENASAAIAVRNLDELTRKGDKFAEQVELRSIDRPSKLFNMLLTFVGITKGLDRQAPTALVMTTFPQEKENESFEKVIQRLVLAVPATDVDQLASCFGFKPGQLKPGQVLPGKAKGGFTIPLFFQVQDKYLLMGMSKKAVEVMAARKPFSKVVAADERKALDQSDFLLLIGKELRSDISDSNAQPFESVLPGSIEPEERRVVQSLDRAAKELEYLMLSGSVDAGLAIRLKLAFADGPASAEFLKSIRGGEGTVGLDGLPEGNLVVGSASLAGSRGNTLLMKTLFHFLMRGITQTDKIISPANRPTFVRLFAHVWERLESSRIAVYQNEPATEHGLFSTIAILEPADSDEFLRSMRELGPFVDSAGLKLSDGQGSGIDEEQIEGLIRDLGSTKFRVRASASTKLALLGEPALTLVEKAQRHDDLEVARRARTLYVQISRSTAERRRKLLEKDLPGFLKPSFAWFPKAETAGSVPVDIVNIRLADHDVHRVPHLKLLLGSDWDKIRIAVVEGKIVVLFGSNVGLFRRAVENVSQRRPGLAGAKSLERFRRHANSSQSASLHLSLQRLTELVEFDAKSQPAKRSERNNATTSLSLAFPDSSLQLDFWIPVEELKPVIRKLR